MSKVLYPGTFDPVTLGHLSVINACSRMFDEVIVGVLVNPEKKPLFALDDRVKMIEVAMRRATIPNTFVYTSDQLAVEVARHFGAGTIARSIRLHMDFEAELVMSFNNAILAPEIQTIWVSPSQELLHISSSAVRELVRRGAFEKLDQYLPENVVDYIRQLQAGSV
ncbi:MAG: Phosphopantetheine adenylyltransferase [bacterium ADurb.Bin400]|nr:MAG: Phosphopantetheine adenylyltransferase [bacterium ADurb.Bin400]